MTITLYTSSTCPYCHQEEEYLNRKNIPFTKVVLDKQPEKLAEFRQVSPDFSGVPLAVIASDNGQALAVRGFNQAELDKVIESISKSEQSDKKQENIEEETDEAEEKTLGGQEAEGEEAAEEEKLTGEGEKESLLATSEAQETEEMDQSASQIPAEMAEPAPPAPQAEASEDNTSVNPQAQASR